MGRFGDIQNPCKSRHFGKWRKSQWLKSKSATLDGEKALVAPEPRGTGGTGSRTKDSPLPPCLQLPSCGRHSPLLQPEFTFPEHVFTLGVFLPSLATKGNGFSQHEEWGGRAWPSHPVSKSNGSCCVCVFVVGGGTAWDVCLSSCHSS